MYGRPKFYLRRVGIDLARARQGVSELSWFLNSWRKFKRLHMQSKADFVLGTLYPCLYNRSEEGGSASGHYFFQDLYVAKRVYERKPLRHADVGSRIDGFVAHVAAFREIDVFDIRPLTNSVENITFRSLDFTKEVPAALCGFYDSVSCLHALEHFGLGRYGDDLDYDGHRKGFKAISKLVAARGTFYLSVPMGPQRIEFNAHRVFSLPYMRELCETEYKITCFSYVDDNGLLHRDTPFDTPAADRNYGCNFGLAIFELQKKNA
jgi:hypothetical protein